VKSEGWIIREYCGEQHVMPNGEIHHLFDCPCHPESDDGVIVHHSFDGREDFETGARKVS
jgi:hypothetical protein